VPARGDFVAPGAAGLDDLTDPDPRNLSKLNILDVSNPAEAPRIRKESLEEFLSIAPRCPCPDRRSLSPCRPVPRVFVVLTEAPTFRPRDNRVERAGPSSISHDANIAPQAANIVARATINMDQQKKGRTICSSLFINKFPSSSPVQGVKRSKAAGRAAGRHRLGPPVIQSLIVPVFRTFQPRLEW
jgi:hypothetical protein